MRICKDFSSKFAFFFLPIFLFQIGTQLNFGNSTFNPIQKGMLFLSTFFILSRFTSLLSAMSIGNLVRKIQAKNALAFSHFLRLIILLLLIFGQNNYFLIILASVYEGLYVNFFWLSFNYLLTENISEKSFGKKIGILNSLLQVVGITSPLMSGLIAFYLGFQTLFWVGIFFVFLSFATTILIKDAKIDDEIGWHELFSWLAEKRFKRLAVSFFGSYVYNESLYLWTLYIFLYLGNIKNVGYLYTFSILIVLILVFFTARYLNSGEKSKKPFYISGGLLSLMWIVRTQFIGLLFLTMIDVCEKLAFNVYGLFFDNLLMKRGKGNQSFSYFVYRNIIIAISGILFWLFFGLVFSFNAGWNSIFILTAIGMILSLLIKENEILK